MAHRNSLMQDGLERVRSAVTSLDREWKQVNQRVTRRRHALERQTQQQVTRLVSQIQRNPWVKRAQTLADDAQRQIEARVGTVLGTLQIASKGDLERIDRRLAQLSRKLKEIEKKETA